MLADSANAQASINLRVLPLGDSITAGYRSTTGDGYRGPLGAALTGQVATLDFVGSQIEGTMSDPDNEGHFSYQIDQLAALTNIALYAYKPNLVLLDVGINDLGNDNDVMNAPTRLGSLIDQILASEPDATILVAQLVVNTTPSVQGNVVLFNNQLASIVQTRATSGKHVALVDMSAVTTDDLADGLHPNDTGYQLMANAWDAAIQQVITKRWINDPAANSASLPTGAIYSGIAGKCLNNLNGSAIAGNAVNLQDCSADALAQQWNLNNSTIAINGLCLDVVGNLTAAGTPVDVWHCNGAPNQVWIVRNGAIVNPAADRCLAEPNASTAGSASPNGNNQLDIEDCTGAPNQQWLVPFAGSIASGAKGLCLDSFGGFTTQGNKIDAYGCNDTAAQQWVFANQTLTFDGKCMDIAKTTTAVNLIDLAACTGAPNQTWTLTNSALVNPATGKCLDNPGTDPTQGLQLDLAVCDGSDRQQWILQTPVLTSPPAPPDQAAPAYAAWNDAFLVQDGTNTYYADEEKSVGTEQAKLYTDGLNVAVAEDAYQHNHSQDQRNLIISLLNTFLSDFGNGTDWSYDGFNDDIGWMTNAVLRGYQITGIPSYLTVAEENWNAAYNRGWNASLGGGIEEDSHPQDGVADREALSDDPFVFTGVTLYQITGDATYLNKAENIYAWVRANLFNSSDVPNAMGAPGQVNQGLRDADNSLISSDNTYNSGSFITAAAALYRVTGNTQYYDDAVLAINHRMLVEPVLHNGDECCGNQWAYWFTYGVSQFATEANLWPQYLPYLQKNASVAWSARNNINLTWNDWTSSTTNTVAVKNPDAVEMESAVAVWQHLPPATPQLDVTYELRSVASGLPIATSGTTQGSQIVQSSLLEGSSSALWTFVSTSGGYYQIRNVSNGGVVSVQAASAVNGAPIIQSRGGKLIPGDNQWLPTQNPDGSYSFYNLNSLQALDVPNGTSRNGQQLDQWFGNSTAAQKFTLVPQQ